MKVQEMPSVEISIEDTRIMDAFKQFVGRMRKEVPESFDGFLTSISLTDDTFANKRGAARGGCFGRKARQAVTRISESRNLKAPNHSVLNVKF